MNRLTAVTLAAWAAVGLALSAGSARAQIAPSSDAPVDVTADRLEAINEDCRAIWSGSAEAVQDQSRLRANTITLINAKTAGRCGVLDRMEAVGEVFYVTPQQTVRSDAAIYTAANDTIVMSGQVVVAQVPMFCAVTGSVLWSRPVRRRWKPALRVVASPDGCAGSSILIRAARPQPQTLHLRPSHKPTDGPSPARDLEHRPAL